jgi:hypothetical protein
LPADLLQRVHHHAAHLEHAAFEDGEEAAGPAPMMQMSVSMVSEGMEVMLGPCPALPASSSIHRAADARPPPSTAPPKLL